ncbi:hypothetical protein ACRAWD_27370 [Caulobacter segnis]
MPERKTLRWIFGGVNDWTPSQAAIHPLRDFLPAPTPPRQTACWRIATAGSVSAQARLVRPRAVSLFQQRRLRRLGLVDHSRRPRRSHRAARPGHTLRRAFPLPLGTGINLEIFEPRFADGALDGSDVRHGRLQLCRSLTLAERDGPAEITFATPPTEVVGRCEADRRAASAGFGVSRGRRPDRQRLARSAKHALGAGLRRLHPGETGCPGNRPCLAHRAPGPGSAGDALGRGPDRFGLDDQHHHHLPSAVPSPPGAYGRCSACCSCCWRWRLLIGLAAAQADPALDWREILGDAAVAYVAVPAALLAGMRASEPRKSGDLALDIAPPLTIITVLAWTHHLSILALLLGVVSGVGRAVARGQRAPDQRRGAISARRSDASLATRRRRVGLVVGLGRTALGRRAGRPPRRRRLGWKERIDLGVTVLAISVVYTP